MIFDVDSTLSALEGIDWLASLRGEAQRKQVADSTKRAMRGELPIAEIYGQRLDIVAPRREEVAALAQEYVSRLVPGSRESLAKLTNSGIHVVLISAGLKEAILPLAGVLGLTNDSVNAVPIHFNTDGSYAGFAADSPLTQNGGKAKVARALRLEGPVLGVGDGITDLELRTSSPPAVDAFAAFTGVVSRPEVVSAADYVIDDLNELVPLVLG